jgi:hypothetical protein
MDGMFEDCLNLEKVPNFDTKNIVENYNCFLDCNKLSIFDKLFFYYKNDPFLIKTIESYINNNNISSTIFYDDFLFDLLSNHECV